MFGAEKSELPHDEIEESEKDEQTEPERWNAGRSCLSRALLIIAHSLEGLPSGKPKDAWKRGAGVFGGVTRRPNVDKGASKPCSWADGDDWNIGLDISEAASDISMVGMTESDMRGSGLVKSTRAARCLRFTLNACGRGGGGGLFKTRSCCSGVFGSLMSRKWKSAGGGRRMDGGGLRGEAMIAAADGTASDGCRARASGS